MKHMFQNTTKLNLKQKLIPNRDNLILEIEHAISLINDTDVEEKQYMKL